MTKFKIKDHTKTYLYWEYLTKSIVKRTDDYWFGIHSKCYFLTDLPAYQIEAFECFLTHNPKAKNLTLESAKELLKTFLDNQK